MYINVNIYREYVQSSYWSLTLFFFFASKIMFDLVPPVFGNFTQEVRCYYKDSVSCVFCVYF